MILKYSIFILLCIKLVVNESKIEYETISDNNNNDIKIETIAIIGGGVGGTSSAYFLQQLLQNDAKFDNNKRKVVIDLFEKNDIIGGRLATRVISGKQYETGGSIIHPRNKYAVNLVNNLGLKQRKAIPTNEKFCIYNGKSFAFCESGWKWITAFKIWYRYGFDPFRMQSKVSNLIDDFEKVYKLQDAKVAFDSVEEMLEAMSPMVYNLTRTRFKEYLMDAGFSKYFINELAQSITLVNYGQDVTVPAFVGMVSYAGAGSNLWSVTNGNKQLPIALAKNSKANILLDTNVNSITKLGDHLFEIEATKKSGEKYTQKYNIVIIATPLVANPIKFLNFSVNLNDLYQYRKLHRTVSTLVEGKLVQRFKGREVLSDNESSFFTSIGKLSAVDDSHVDNNVYKVFSHKPLSSEQLHLLFDDIKHTDITDWLAYPHYDSISLPLPRFKLHAGIFHVNAIEWAASAIEMSLIAGKNAALLTYSQLGGKTSKPYAEKISRKIINEEL